MSLSKICKDLDVISPLDKCYSGEKLYFPGLGSFFTVVLEVDTGSMILTKLCEHDDIAYSRPELMEYEIAKFFKMPFILKGLDEKIILVCSQDKVNYLLSVDNTSLQVSNYCKSCKNLVKCDLANEFVKKNLKDLTEIRDSIKIMTTLETMEKERIKTSILMGYDESPYQLQTKVVRGKEVISVVKI